MEKFVTSIKKKYREKLINRQKQQWPPRYGSKLIKLELVEGERVEGYSAHYQRGSHQQRSNEKRTPIAYADIFQTKGRNPVRKVVIEGEAGIGKSTLCTAVAEDWANEDIFHQFKLLLYLPLSDERISTAQSLQDILKLLHPNQLIRKSVADYLEEEEGENALVVADGWDELSELHRSEESFLYNLCFGELLPFLSVLLTSRPSSSAILHRLSHIHRFVEVSGFTRECIIEYVQSEFAQNEAKGHRLLKQLDSNPVIGSVCTVPLNCAIVCHLWRTLEEALPSTLTELYTKIILNVILRDIRKKFPTLQTLSDFEGLPKKLQVLWWNLCEFAFEALKRDQIVFSQGDFFQVSPSLLEDVLCFGLLQSAESILDVGHGTSFHFLHLTFQEYLAALHLVRLPVATQIDFCRSHADSLRFPMVWRFFFGIGYGSLKTNATRANIHPAAEDVTVAFVRSMQGTLTSKLLLCHCALESKNEQVSNYAAQRLGPHLGGFLSPRNAHDCAAVVHVITNTEIATTADLQFSHCSLGDQGMSPLINGLAKRGKSLHIKELYLSSNNLTDRGIGSLFFAAPAPLQSLEELDLSDNSITGKGIEHILATWQRLPSTSLKILSLSNNPLRGTGIVALEKAVRADLLPDLEVMFLDGCLIGEAEGDATILESFLDALSVHCADLFQLVLSENNLGVPEMLALGSGMSMITEYQHAFFLNLVQAIPSDKGMSAFTQNLKRTCHFRELHMGKNGIHTFGVSCLAESICFGKLDVNELLLNGNSLGLEGITVIGKTLSGNYCNLWKLDLTNCNLTTATDDRTYNIGKQLCKISQNTTVRHLVVNQNSFTGDNIHILVGLVCLCLSLQRLDSSNCNLTSDDLLNFFSEVSQVKLSQSSDCCSKLTDWYLDDNAVDDYGVAALVGHLSSLLPKLERPSFNNNPVSMDMKQRLDDAIKEQQKVLGYDSDSDDSDLLGDSLSSQQVERGSVTEEKVLGYDSDSDDSDLLGDSLSSQQVERGSVTEEKVLGYDSDHDSDLLGDSLSSQQVEKGSVTEEKGVQKKSEIKTTGSAFQCQRNGKVLPDCKWKLLVIISAFVAVMFVGKWWLSAGENPECHKIASKHELQQAVAIVGYWQGLCQSLGVADAVINNLVYSSNHDEEKKRQCLNSFFDMGDVCWEAVVIAVAKYPINNPRQARKIAKEYNVDYTKLKVKGEL